MILSKRSKATIFSVLVFGAALIIYFATRPQDAAPEGSPGGADNSDAVNRGRALGRTLAGLLGGHRPDPNSDLPPTHVAGPVCDKCTTDNCPVGDVEGCDVIPDPADRKLCEDLYKCFADTKNSCVIQGDPVRCWCGTHLTTCVTDNAPATMANGPCVKEVFAAAKSNDADTVFQRFMNNEFPIGRAVRITSCRGSYCSDDCKIR
jgi:hypothetical protein